MCPAASKGATYNNFTVAPVRFEASTGNRTDPWAHMQLDALGLFLTAYGVFGAHRLLTPDITLVRITSHAHSHMHPVSQPRRFPTAELARRGAPPGRLRAYWAA